MTAATAGAAPEQRWLVNRALKAGLAAALETLTGDSGLRRRLGEANRVRARAEYDVAAMVAAYRDVYAEAMGRQKFP